MKRDIFIASLFIVALIAMSAGPTVFNVRRGDSSGVSYVDTLVAHGIRGVAVSITDSIDATYVTADTTVAGSATITTGSITTGNITTGNITDLIVTDSFNIATTVYTVTGDGKQDNIQITIDTFLLNTSAADSFWVYDDGDTIRATADNPVELTGNFIVDGDIVCTDWAIGTGTFGTAETADTVTSTAIEAGDYAFITWTLKPDSVYEVGGGYAVTIKEDTLIVTCAYKETGTTYNYWVIDQ